MLLQRTPFGRAAFVPLISLEFQFWLFNLNVSFHFLCFLPNWFHIHTHKHTAQITVKAEWKLINDTSIQVLHSKSIPRFVHLLSSTISNSCSNYISMLLLFTVGSLSLSASSLPFAPSFPCKRFASTPSIFHSVFVEYYLTIKKNMCYPDGIDCPI